MEHEPEEFFLGEVEVVLPDVARVEVVVLGDLVVVGHALKAARVQAKQPPKGVHQCIVLTGISTKTQAIIDECGAPGTHPAGSSMDASMPKTEGFSIVGREDHRRPWWTAGGLRELQEGQRDLGV